MAIYCYNDNCANNDLEGNCFFKSITLDEDGFCEDYEEDYLL